MSPGLARVGIRCRGEWLTFPLMNRCIVVALVFLLSAGLRANIDPKSFDLSVKPQDDFNQYVNGGWMKTHPVPPAYSSWGAFHEVEEHNEAALHSILERAADSALSFFHARDCQVRTPGLVFACQPQPCARIVNRAREVHQPPAIGCVFPRWRRTQP